MMEGMGVGIPLSSTATNVMYAWQINSGCHETCGWTPKTFTPTSMDVLKTRFTDALMVRIVPTVAGLKKRTLSIEIVVTLRLACVYAAMQAALSRSDVRCPPNT